MRRFSNLLRITILFGASLVTATSQQQDTSKCVLGEAPFVYVEHMPEFPGGQKALIDYIHSHLIYPESAKIAKLEGSIVSQFIVDPNGKVICPKIIRGISKDCDLEVLRLIYNFPLWIAGKHNDKAVYVSFTLPVKFEL